MTLDGEEENKIILPLDDREWHGAECDKEVHKPTTSHVVIVAGWRFLVSRKHESSSLLNDTIRSGNTPRTITILIPTNTFIPTSPPTQLPQPLERLCHKRPNSPYTPTHSPHHPPPRRHKPTKIQNLRNRPRAPEEPQGETIHERQREDTDP